MILALAMRRAGSKKTLREVPVTYRLTAQTGVILALWSWHPARG